MNAQSYCSRTGKTRSRSARLGWCGWYGIYRLVPSGPQRHPWNGHLDTVTDNSAAVADVSAEVFAVRLQDVQLAALVAVGDEIVAEIVQRPDLADREFGRPTDHEPTGDFPGERNFHTGSSSTRGGDTKYVTVWIPSRGGVAEWQTNSKRFGS